MPYSRTQFAAIVIVLLHCHARCNNLILLGDEIAPPASAGTGNRAPERAVREQDDEFFARTYDELGWRAAQKLSEQMCLAAFAAERSTPEERVKATLRQAWIYLLQNDDGNAEKLLGDAARLCSSQSVSLASSADLMWAQGIRAHVAGRDADARALIDKSFAHNAPANSEVSFTELCARIDLRVRLMLVANQTDRIAWLLEQIKPHTKAHGPNCTFAIKVLQLQGRAASDMKTAQSLLESAMALVTPENTSAIERASLERDLAVVLIRQQRYGSAREAFQRRYALLAGKGADHAAEAAEDMATINMLESNWTEARRFSDEAFAAIKSESLDNWELRLRLLRQSATLCTFEDRSAEGEPLLDKALQLAKTGVFANGYSTAKTLYSRARYFLRVGKRTEALDDCAAALKIYNRVRGSKNPATEECFKFYAQLLLERG